METQDEEDEEIVALREKQRHFRERIEGQLAGWEAAGSNLGDKGFAFLRAVAERDHHEARQLFQNNRRAMNGRERGRKREIRLKLRNGLRDLAELAHSVEPGSFQPWFTKKDAKEVYDLGDLARIVSYTVSLFGEEYADRLLEALTGFYEMQGKEVQVLKKFGRAALPEGLRS